MDRQLGVRDRVHRAEHGGAAALVVLHALHAVVHLQRVAAGVVGERLADERERLAARLRTHALGLVFENGDQASLRAALANGDDAAHSELLRFSKRNQLEHHARGLRQLLGFTSKPIRRADVGRSRRDATRLVHAGCDLEASGKSFGKHACSAIDRQRACSRRALGRLAVEHIDAPVGDGHSFAEALSEFALVLRFKHGAERQPRLRNLHALKPAHATRARGARLFRLELRFLS